jgi:DNA-3-methyladenine glycosylase I
MKNRCEWVGNNPLYIEYHDNEWGVPVYDDQTLFEFLILEGHQAGLNWITILKKRKNYYKAFDSFNAEKIANYDQTKVEQLLMDSGIIRNRLKIESAIINARQYLKIKTKFVGFHNYIWQFVNRSPIINKWKSLSDIPATTKESDTMSKDLKGRGFKFVGSTICYAFMQAVGMVNDHKTDCFRYDEINRKL